MTLRSNPWLVAAICLVAGSGLWLLRARRVHAGPEPQPDPAALVRRAWTEGARIAHQGEQELLTADADGRPARLRARVVNNGAGQLCIEYLSPPLEGVTVWENGDRTYRWNPRGKRLTVASRRADPGEQGRQAQELLRNYVAARAGVETVAGRRTVIVELRPRRGAAAWKRLWIDPQTGTILATEDRAGEQTLLRSTRYRSVRYLSPGEIPDPSRFRPAPELIERYATALAGDTSGRFEPSTLSELTGFQVRTPSWLPPGYSFRGGYLVPCGCGAKHQAVRLEFSDGLHLLTLFQCGRPTCARGPRCFGSDAPGMSAARYGAGGYNMLAVGDIPHADLERLLAATR